jgi:hypothetical protein
MYIEQQREGLLPFDPHGWLYQPNQVWLDRLVQEINPSVVVEIGSWFGASTRFIAERLPQDGVVYAIDTFLGSEEHFALGLQELVSRVRKQFLSNVIHCQLQHRIFPLQMNSEDAVRLLNVTPQLIYVDGDHSEEGVYRDISSWWEKLATDGTMCGDDYVGAHPGVHAAVDRFAAEKGLTVNSDVMFWWFSRKEA